MTPDQIAEDKRICEAATKGPWIRHDNYWGTGGYVRSEDNRLIANVNEKLAGLEHVEMLDNSIFIARARTRWPLYIAALEQARARIAELEKLISEAPNIVDQLAKLEAENKAMRRVVEAAKFLLINGPRRDCYERLKSALAQLDGVK